MERPFRCPACKFVFSNEQLEYRISGFKAPSECPYSTTPYPELCSLHDKIYFGKWRKMDAEAFDVRRAYERIARLLSMIQETAAREDARAAREHIDKSSSELALADPDAEPFISVKFLDRALSYAHHAINDLLREKGARLHDPADYERHYDTILPFKEDW
jgi:hypothetical protein